MKSWAMVLAGLAVVAVAASGTAALVISRSRAESRERAQLVQELAKGPRVETARVTAAPPVRDITLPGEVHGLAEATLYAKISGYLRLIQVDKGDHVTSGEILGVIEAPEVADQVVSKRADLAIKKLTEARYAPLAKSGIVTQQDFDQAKANVKIAEAELKQIESLSGYQVIRAPFEGVVTARFADPGALLQAATQSVNALPLVSIANMDRVRVQAFLAQGEALFVRVGDRAVLWADEKPDVRTEATVTRLAKELDPRTRTMLTEVEIDNARPSFYPGSIVRVKLSLAMPEALAVPADTLLESEGKFVVARVDGDRVRFVPVDVVDTDGKETHVRGELKPGDVVVRHPGDDVVDGARVQTQP